MKAARSLVVIGAPVALAGLVLFSTGATARADESARTDTGGTVTGMSALAVAMQTVYQSLNVPFGLPVAIGSYGASAAVDGGGSTSDAGAPYSPLISSLPSTGSGAAGSAGYPLPVVPEFPGYVSAQYPSSPTAAQQAGMYELSATTSATEAEGRVGIGAAPGISETNNLFALARTVNRADTIDVRANAGAVAVSLPGILDLANVSSEIRATRGIGGGAPLFTSTTSLGTITLAGTTSGVTGDGSQVAGTSSTPINSDTLPALNQALAPAGVSLSYLPQVFLYTDGTSSSGRQPVSAKTVRGLTSGALQIRFQKDVQGQGPTTETITVGQVSVTADGATATSPAGSADPAASGPVGSSSTPPAGATPLTGLGAIAAPSAVTLPSTAEVPQTVALTQAPTGVAVGGRVGLDMARIERLNFSLDSTYPMVVGVGAAMLFGSFVTRVFGVRLGLRRG
jgi:hypothetical protein